MIDEALARRLPRPLNHGATLFLFALALGLVALGMLATTVGSFESYAFTCTASAPPDLMLGLLCSTLTLVVTVLPMWLIFPPSRRAVEQDDEGLSWDRPHLTGGLKLMFACLLVWGVGLGLAAGTTGEVEWYADVGGLGSCGEMPEWVHGSIRARTQKGLLVATGFGGLLLLTGWLARRRWRPADRLELDERGLVLNGDRWSFKDLTRVEVVDHALFLEAHDGRRAELGLFAPEVAFAEQLAEVVRARLPAQTEDRSEARARLESVTKA